MKREAFVLMPFAEELVDVYDYLISDGLTAAGYHVRRADDVLSQNNILADIVDGIVSSDLIVADLTGSNPNVYYELGIAHALNKKVILLAQDLDELPFDLRSYRVVLYSVHFSKMNKAKDELVVLATEAAKGELPFGNPVKDFYKDGLVRIDRPSERFDDSERDEEMGLLDFQIALEEGFEELGQIVTKVGVKLEKEVTPEITSSGIKLNSGSYTAKQKRNIIRELAGRLQEYGSFVKPNNVRYRDVLKNIETSLDSILGGNFDLEHGSEEKLQEFLDVLAGVEESAFLGRQGFASLIETMDSLPKIERTFNRANIFMATELKEFVNNIDQTISIISRAVRLGRSLLMKIQNDPEK